MDVDQTVWGFNFIHSDNLSAQTVQMDYSIDFHCLFNVIIRYLFLFEASATDSPCVWQNIYIKKCA